MEQTAVLMRKGKDTTQDKPVFPMFQPHPGQDAVLANNTRFQLIAAGRRWGKTNFALRRGSRIAVKYPGCDIWIVSPTGTDQEVIWEKAKRALDINHPAFGGPFIKKIRETVGYRRIWLFNGSSIWFKSAESKLGGRGGGDRVRFIIGDEFSYWDPTVWKDMRPVLMDCAGEACLIFTPNKENPKNFAYERWLMGQEYVDGTCPECNGGGCDKCSNGIVPVPNPNKKENYKSWRFSSYDNPHLPPGEVDLLIAEEGWGQTDIRREIYAEFVSGAGAVFRLEDLHACQTSERSNYVSGVSYTMGVDFGKSEDWTVYVIIDNEGCVVDYDRFQGPWPLQCKRIAMAYRQYGQPLTTVDTTNMGAVIEEFLRLEGVTNVVKYAFNGPTKATLIDGLRVAVESGQIALPREWTEMEREMAHYEAALLPSGRISYRAPKGYHDDIVDATALAWYGYLQRQRRGDAGLKCYII